MTLFRPLSIAALAAVLLASPSLAQDAAGAFPPGNPPDVQDWRQQYEQTLREDYGWLSVAGLTFLPDGTYVIGSAPGSDIPLPAGHAPEKVGTVVVAGGVATLRLESGVQAQLNGEPAPAEAVLKKAERGAPGQSSTPPDKVRVGKVEFHLHESGPRLAMRVRDPESPIRIGFQGPKWFPTSEAARVVATLKPYEEPKTVEVRNILGDPEPYQAPGQLEFTWDGRKVRVLVFTAAKGRLQVIFRDAAFGRETYGTRYVYAEPTGDGRYVIDFNRAYNPPCAYNPYTTCPTPPSQNVLKVAIRAGEKIYDGPAAHASR
jgi:uncharacterized protein (DUF1684 family)